MKEADLGLLAQVASGHKIILVGEGGHWGAEPKRVLVALLSALDAQSPKGGLLALELPYSMTPWLARIPHRCCGQRVGREGHALRTVCSAALA
jgi:hypothetical protein